MDEPLPSLLPFDDLPVLGLELPVLDTPLGMRPRVCSLGLAEIDVEVAKVPQSRVFEGLVVKALERANKARFGWVRHDTSAEMEREAYSFTSDEFLGAEKAGPEPPESGKTTSRIYTLQETDHMLLQNREPKTVTVIGRSFHQATKSPASVVKLWRLRAPVIRILRTKIT